MPVSGHIHNLARFPRSFLFYIVANVGPGGSSRPIAVAYRQGNFVESLSKQPLERAVRDTLRLISIFSEPANRVALEAEIVLATAWYQRIEAEKSDDLIDAQLENSRRPEVPDDTRLRYGWYASESWAPIPQSPTLPWDDSPREFPFASTCVLLGLLRDDGFNKTRLGDVQLQPLSTVFRATYIEYGMVVLDVSNLDEVKYGILAFPIRYHTEIRYSWEGKSWDPIEYRTPTEEPFTLPIEDRPRVPLSIFQNWRSYFQGFWVDTEPYFIELQKHPTVDVGVLDYIWPADFAKQRTRSGSIVSSITNYFWPSKPATIDDDASARAKRLAEADVPHNGHMDRAFDNLLILTQHDLELDEKTIVKFEKLAEFRVQLRRRLEELPDSLGPSEASGHVLRIAYAGCAHLNWVRFRNISYEAIAESLASKQLHGATGLSICVDGLQGDFSALITAFLHCPSLKKICLLQGPDRSDDELSVHLFTQLLESSPTSWLRDKTIYSTSAFSAPLCRETWLPTNVAPPYEAYPVSCIFVRRKIGTDESRKNQDECYFLGDACLTAERFAVGFLTYLNSMHSDNAILQLASAPPTLGDLKLDDSSVPLAASPIPAEWFASLDADDENFVTAQSLVPGSWVVLISVEHHPDVTLYKEVAPSESYHLQYSFVKVCQGATDRDAGSETAKVAGGLTEFLGTTAPCMDTALVEKLLEETEMAIRSRIKTPSTSDRKCIEVMEEVDARVVFDDLRAGTWG